jgi:hypothetical protein
VGATSATLAMQAQKSAGRKVRREINRGD